MFHYFYLSTVDRKRVAHQYKLPAGEAVPDGQEITGITVAGTARMADLLSVEKLLELRKAFPQADKRLLKDTVNAKKK